MTTYFVSSGGSNTSPYDTWAKAATSLQTALTAASTSGDIVVIQYNAVPSADMEVSANTTWTLAANIALVCASNGGGANYTLTPMGTSNWIGNSTTTRNIAIAGGVSAYVYGLTIAQAASGTKGINTTDGGDFYFDNCLVWNPSTSSSTNTTIGNASNAITRFKNCTFRCDRTSTSATKYVLRGRVEFNGVAITAQSTYVGNAGVIYDGGTACGTIANFIGCDLSGLPSSVVMVGDCTATAARFEFTNCKLPTSAVMLATQTILNGSSASVTMRDCSTGDVHGNIEEYTSLGSLVSDRTIKVTAGAAGQSWKIVTSAAASRISPFVTPWIDLYHSSASAITPYLEILRDGSATAYTNKEVWAEIAVKDVSGSVVTRFYDDAGSVNAAGANQANGAGASIWEGENATCWSGKCDSGAAITPAEVGHIRARLCFAAASATVYLDPQIRT